MIQVNNYYKVLIDSKLHTVKVIQELENGDFFGTYSISNHINKSDGKGIIIPSNAREASLEEIEAWDQWFRK